jgi:L-ribulose-5-phosphate 4-epimerase
MEEKKIEGDYELETGFQILNCFRDRNLNYEEVQMILVGSHAPFTWGKDANTAVYNSAVLENIAQMALLTEGINPDTKRLKDALVKKHYERKHGPGSYYGQ